MGAIATFDYAGFLATFPEFAAVPQDAITGYWAMAEQLHANDGCGPIASDAMQLQCMNLVTAFVAALFSTPSGAPISPDAPVGRVSSASEGSVSVSLEMVAQSESAAFWNQNRYGSLYWRMILPFRLARYRSRYTWTGGVPPAV